MLIILILYFAFNQALLYSNHSSITIFEYKCDDDTFTRALIRLLSFVMPRCVLENDEFFDFMALFIQSSLNRELANPLDKCIHGCHLIWAYSSFKFQTIFFFDWKEYSEWSSSHCTISKGEVGACQYSRKAWGCLSSPTKRINSRKRGTVFH